MKKPTHLCIAAAAALLAAAAVPLHAQTAPAPTAAATSTEPDVIVVGKQKFALMSTMGTIAANYEFQQNVQKVRMQRQAILDFVNRERIALTEPEKFALKKLIDAGQVSLNENNQKMKSIYGFDLNANYLVEVVKSRAYVLLSEDDYKKVTDEEKKRPDYIIARTVSTPDGKESIAHFRQIGAIEDIKKNQQFNDDNQAIQYFNEQVARLKAAREQTTDEAAIKQLDERISKAQDELLKRSDAAAKTYGFNPATPGFLLQYEDTRLRMAVNEEQINIMRDALSKKTDTTTKK